VINGALSFLVLMLLTRANHVLPMDMRLVGKKEE